MGSLFTLGGHRGGITWLKYSPTQDGGWYLFSGARKDNKILQWDMRNYTEPLQVFERNVKTNQRIYYDLTPKNTWLASGDTEGLLRIWHLSDKEQQYEVFEGIKIYFVMVGLKFFLFISVTFTSGLL